jgi:hypothetical protein
MSGMERIIPTCQVRGRVANAIFGIFLAKWARENEAGCTSLTYCTSTEIRGENETRPNLPGFVSI